MRPDLTDGEERKKTQALPHSEMLNRGNVCVLFSV